MNLASKERGGLIGPDPTPDWIHFTNEARFVTFLRHKLLEIEPPDSSFESSSVIYCQESASHCQTVCR